MKALFFGLLISLSLNSNASEAVSAERPNSELSILDSVVSVKSAMSKSSGLYAKAIEVLAGDGMNAMRVVLVVNNLSASEGETTRIFNLQNMLRSVDRVTFVGKDQLLINATMDEIDVKSGKNIIRKKNIKVKLSRNDDKSLSDFVIVD